MHTGTGFANGQMHTGTGSALVELDGKTRKQVEQFKYVGSKLVREGGCKEDVKIRCLKAAQDFYKCSPILGHKEISMTTNTQYTDHKGCINPNSTLPE